MNRTRTRELDGKHWILWDGECGLCRRIIQWVRRNDRRSRFTTSAYQEAPSPPMTPALFAACERAVHVVSAEGEVLRAGRASLFILERIGWGRVARLLSLPPFIWVVEAVYRIVADHRNFFARFIFTREHDSRPEPRPGGPNC